MSQRHPERMKSMSVYVRTQTLSGPRSAQSNITFFAFMGSIIVLAVLAACAA
jgi:hypothetical protein